MSGSSIPRNDDPLSPQAFGPFFAAIPAPLGIGTLDLADGTSTKGFLCEAICTDDADDITRFGSWRAYITALEDA